MIVDKTKLGIALFDENFGGVYRGRQVLCSGKKGSGKTVFAYHFLNQALQDGDKALLLSNYRAQDTIIVAESLGMPFDRAVTDGQLTILEYAAFIPEKSTSANVMLPPQSFMELQEAVETHSIRRIAFDTVLPWVAIHPVDRISEHVYSFIHALERLSVTALLTLPKPVSNPAYALKSRIEDLCPIAVNLEHTDGANRLMRITKYLGEPHKLSEPIPFAIAPEHGIVAESVARAVRAETPPPSVPETPPPSPPAPAPQTKPIHFSSVIHFP